MKTAVIGVGSLGRHHARIHASLSEVELIGVCDTDEARGQELAREFRTRFFSSADELIGQVDAVSIAVPTTAHHDVCRQFLDAGVHVLVEKPICTTVEEAADLIDRARKSGVVLQVGHLERFNPAFLAVKNFISQPKFFEAHRLGIFVPRSLDVNVIMDLMIHDIDMILALVRSPVTEIRAVGIPILTDKIDIANVRIEFESGVVANLTASRVSSEKVRKLRFFQPNDYVSIDFGRQSAGVYSLRTADNPFGKEIISRNIVVEQGEPLRNEIVDFLECIRDKRSPVCTGEDGLAALETAQKILDTMHTV